MDTLVTAPPHHAISSAGWGRGDLVELFDHAEWMSRQSRARRAVLAPHRRIGLCFYQNSTRTRISFEAAACLIGAQYVGFSDAHTTRAGDFFEESLEDTIKVLSTYTDLLVLRHVDDDAAQRAARVADVPIINAGTGESDHPTQGMLDTWMMLRETGSLAGARVGLVGDPGCRALRAILTCVLKFGPGEVLFLTPESVSVPPEEVEQLRGLGVPWATVDSAAEMARRADLISMIPFELPDFHVATATEKRSDTLPGRFVFGRRLLETAGRRVPIFHTGPRGGELPAEVDGLPNIRYFDGVEHGMYLRAALAHLLMERRAD